MHSFRPHHIPALDGLRGIAILLVIVHHQLVPLPLTGGFLGVDLFFVLSGFLITSLLLKEFSTTKSISLTRFYARRVLRLAPALLLYLIATLLVIYFLHPEEFRGQLKLVVYAATYLTNWRLALGWDYSLDATAIIWSLSIEEQFYLLWPPVLIAILYTKIKHQYIAMALIALIAGVALHRVALWSVGAELNRMYYGTDTRADSLFAGCLTAFISQFQLPVRLQAALHMMALFSLGALAYLVATSSFNGPFLYRGGYTLVAVATGSVIWSVANSPGSWIANVLAWSPLRWFGKISYGLYLWHWLLLRDLSFYRWAGEWETPLRLALAIGISAVSFYFIETPFNSLKEKFSYLRVGPTAEATAEPRSIGLPFGSPVIIQPSEQNS
jgi:peptidoglycan/LPS O-acetylase OafA/YrhL